MLSSSSISTSAHRLISTSALGNIIHNFTILNLHSEMEKSDKPDQKRPGEGKVSKKSKIRVSETVLLRQKAEKLLKEPDLTGEEQEMYIKMIENGGARLLNIINEQIEFMHTFFKPEADQKGISLFYTNSVSCMTVSMKNSR